MNESELFRNRISQIDGGEITDQPNGYAYSVIFPTAASQPFIYTTKTQATGELLGTSDWNFPCGLIARYGVPSEEHLAGLIRIIGDNQVYFLGDCDPFDLLVFAWLHQHLTICYLGVSDQVVSVLGVNVTDPMTISLPVEEQRALVLLQEVWPGYRTSVGANCAALLNRGRKLELEAVLSYKVRSGNELLKRLN